MGVYNASTGTRYTKAGLPLTPYTDPDPQFTVTATLKSRKAFYGAEDPLKTEGTQEQILANAGDRVRQSDIDGWFVSADITGVSPSTGVATAGGPTITVTGTGLDGVTALTVGGTAATNVTVVAPNKLTFTAPAKAAGTYPIVATDDSGTITETAAITYA